MRLDDVLNEKVGVSRRGFGKILGVLGTFFALGSPVRADELADLESRIAKAPTFEDCKSLGNKYLETKQYDKAIQTYTKALSIKGYEHDNLVLHQRGVAYSESGRFKEGITDYEHSLRYNSTDPATRRALSLNQYRLARDNKDVELAKKAIHNLWLARELAYAQSVSVTMYDEDLEYYTKKAREEFPKLDTSEKGLGMTREERHGAANELGDVNRVAALYFYRKLIAENKEDYINKDSLRSIPRLERYIKRHNLREISLR